MKKLIALAAIAACIPAFAASVESSNVVGYTKVSVGAGYNIIGQQFLAVGGESASVQTITAGEGFDPWGTDSIQVWDNAANQYVDYYYYSEDAGGVGEDCKAGWGDLDQVIMEDVVSAGTAFWANVSEDADVTTVGEVSADTTVEVKAGYNLVCNPQPAAFDIQDLNPGEGFDPWGTDSIQIWDNDANTYIDFYYYSEDAGGVGDECKAGWGDLDQVIMEYTVPVGCGFWANATDDTTFTFPNALPVDEE